MSVSAVQGNASWALPLHTNTNTKNQFIFSDSCHSRNSLVAEKVFYSYGTDHTCRDMPYTSRICGVA